MFDQKEGRHYITEYRIPHLLILDYLAATYLSSLHTSDLTNFMTKLRELIEGTIHDIDKFEYLWFFTVAQNRDVGRAALDVLKQELNNVDFVIRVAFECHAKGVTAPVTATILNKRYLLLRESRSFPAYVYSLDTSSTLVSIILLITVETCAIKRRHFHRHRRRKKKSIIQINRFFATE